MIFRSFVGYTKSEPKNVNYTHLFQLEENEKHLELENVVMGWQVTFQATVLLMQGQTLEETLASSLLVHLVTP